MIDIPAADFGVKPETPFKDEIIYEVHLRGLTKNDPSVPANFQGTYAGAATRAGYLRDLGVTAIELARAGIFGVTTFAYLAMSTVELESHTASVILKQLCTLLNAENGFLAVYL
ncbi:MAG TPA: hypothetical protein VIY49_38020 [Bryobacteraceae bacterium]